MTNSRCGAGRSAVTVGQIFRRVNEATHEVFIMHMGKDINLVVKTSQDFDQDKKGRNIQRPKDDKNENNFKSHHSHTHSTLVLGNFQTLCLKHSQDSNMQSQYHLGLKSSNKHTCTRTFVVFAYVFMILQDATSLTHAFKVIRHIRRHRDGHIEQRSTDVTTMF